MCSEPIMKSKSLNPIYMLLFLKYSKYSLSCSLISSLTGTSIILVQFYDDILFFKIIIKNNQYNLNL